MVDKITSPVGANDVIKKINDAIDAIPTSTTQLTNDSGYITGITSSMVTSALGFTPYSNANPSGYQANVIETIKVNNTAQTVTSKTVNITVPAEVTETTVSGWGFTKNAGTVTKVNNVSPDASGNVTIPTGGTVDQTFNASSTNAQSGTAIAGAGFITGITSSMVTSALGYTPYNSTNPSGYQANVLETIKVNGTAQTPSSKTVNITVPTTTTAVTSGSTAALTSGGAYSNLVRLSGAQTITGNKTFSGNVVLGANATATTPASSSNTTAVATTAFVKAQGYITGINSSDVTTALGYTPYSSANPSGYISGISSSDVTTALGYTPYSSANPSGYEANTINTIKVNGTAQTVTSKTVDITVPTTTTAVTSGSSAALTSGGAYSNLLRLSGAQTVSGNKTFSGTTTISGTIGLGSKATATTPTVTSNDTTVATTKFVKDQGYITGISSTDVTNALGFTPYSNANPNGYTSNVGTVTSVNNVQPDANGNVTIQAGGVTDVKVDNTSVVSGGVANIDLTGYAQKSGAIFSGDVYAQSLYQKSTINPSNYVQSLTPETVDTYSANKTLSNIGSTSSPNFDGQIIKLSNMISVSLSSTVNHVYTIDLSNYITFPDNTYDYELYGILSISSSNDSRLSLSNSDDVGIGSAMAWLRSGSNSRQDATCFVIPVASTSRKLYYKTESAAFTSAAVIIWGYRRIGTNT